MADGRYEVDSDHPAWCIILEFCTDLPVKIRPCHHVYNGANAQSRLSPLADLLPDRCTPELRRLQAELSARHSYREAARLLSTLLPCDPMNHATMRNRTHRVAADLEQKPIVQPGPEPVIDPAAEIVVLIDGAHIRAVHSDRAEKGDPTGATMIIAELKKGA